MINLENKDCFEYLKTLKDCSIDFISIDPPYGKIQGMLLQGQTKKVNGDINIDGNLLFTELNRVLKNNGTIACFAQLPTLCDILNANRELYKYEYVGIKNNCAQGFHSNKMCLTYHEHILIFIKDKTDIIKRKFNKNIVNLEIDKKLYPNRGYAQQICKYINEPRAIIHKKMGHRKLEFFLFYTGTLFNLPKKEYYEKLVEIYNLRNGDLYIPYEKLSLERNFNIKLDNNKFSTTLKSTLYFSKEKKSLHPTQKPLSLIEFLIKTYSNENDNVLDCFSGSGTTALACKKLNRNFYGCELDKEYYEKSLERLKDDK